MKLFGVMPSGGAGTQFLTRLMGPSRCLRFLLEAEPATPRQAEGLGLLEETQGFAARVAQRAGRVGTGELPLLEAVELDPARFTGTRCGEAASCPASRPS
jgi:enoyl-CoA hydratase/carnithine racemase